MRTLFRSSLVALGLATLVPHGSAFGLDPLTETGGGGVARTDCYATFKSTLNVPVSRPRNVRCVDGDAACDGDGVVNGVCAFSVAVCANSTYDTARCNSTGIESLTVLHADDNGADPKFDPDLQALQANVDSSIMPPTTTTDVCTSPSTIHVRIKGPVGKPFAQRDTCSRRQKLVRLTTLPQPLVGASDGDTLRLTCLPAPAELLGCDAQQLFGGTFDRLQKQVFSTSCAVGTCHDSESYMNANGLLLEPGASHGNLVGQTPTNFAAAGLGWKRVTAGSSATSFLYHKVMNDLDDASGLDKRMPRPPGRPMLHRSLREIIRVWIDAGAPDSGWVDGTF